MALLHPSVLGVLVVTVAEYAAQHGVDPTAALSAYGLSLNRLKIPMVRVRRDYAASIIEGFKGPLDDPHYHIRAACKAPLGSYHVADYFTLFASTVGVGYSLTMKCIHLVDTALEFQCFERAEHVEARLVHHRGDSLYRCEPECLLSTFASRVPKITEGVSQPCTIRLKSPLAAGWEALEEELHVRFSFEPSLPDALLIPLEAWHAPSLYADPNLHAILDKAFVHSSLPDHTGQFLRKIEAAVSMTLASKASLESVAALLYMSSRTLQRRLEELGMQFRDVATIVKQRQAIDLLRHSTMTIAQIAERLGYSESSSFTRAFKRLTGLAPSEFQALPAAAQDQLEAKLKLEDLLTIEDIPEDVEL